jgi:hypothetical protein
MAQVLGFGLAYAFGAWVAFAIVGIRNLFWRAWHDGPVATGHADIAQASALACALDRDPDNHGTPMTFADNPTTPVNYPLRSIPLRSAREDRDMTGRRQYPKHFDRAPANGVRGPYALLVTMPDGAQWIATDFRWKHEAWAWLDGQQPQPVEASLFRQQHGGSFKYADETEAQGTMPE